MRTLISYLQPPPAAPRLPSSQIDALYRSWRLRQIGTVFIGYAVFYFVRKNLPLAMPPLARDLGFSTAQLGLFLTAHDLLYGVSKFGNGVLADRSNPRYFMAAGLLLSAVANLAFGLSSGLLTLGLLWLVNGWFQGMGFPPCARVLSHWVGERERGVIWGIWNSSHQIGAASIFVLAGALVSHYGWRAGFLVPAGLALLVSLFILHALRDTPASLGLPPVEEYLASRTPAAGGQPTPTSAAPSTPPSPSEATAFRDYLQEQVFGRPELWLLCLANFFVYVIRYGVMNWAPLYLSNVRGQSLLHAGTSVAGFELAGLVGALLAGWLRDRWFGGRCAALAMAYMLATAVALALFWKLPQLSSLPFSDGAVLLAVGFFIYGPQFLVGVCAASLVGPRGVATAIGLTGLFGYASSAVSGLGFGVLVAHSGWDAPFVLMTVGAVAAALCFLLLGPAERQVVPQHRVP